MSKALRSTFKVTNTTIKPKKLSPDGKDTRTLVERVGHGVQFKTEDGKRLQILQANESAFVHELDGGLLGLRRGGFVSIKEVDIGQELTKDALGEPEARRTSTRKPGRVTASLMGEKPKPSAGGLESSEAVNPDGDPNFIARARHDGPTVSTGAEGFNVIAKPKNGNRRKVDGQPGSQS